MAETALPPLPEGFTLDAPVQAVPAELPPLPEGFKLDPAWDPKYRVGAETNATKAAPASSENDGIVQRVINVAGRTVANIKGMAANADLEGAVQQAQDTGKTFQELVDDERKRQQIDGEKLAAERGLKVPKPEDQWQLPDFMYYPQAGMRYLDRAVRDVTIGDTKDAAAQKALEAGGRITSAQDMAKQYPMSIGAQEFSKQINSSKTWDEAAAKLYDQAVSNPGGLISFSLEALGEQAPMLVAAAISKNPALVTTAGTYGQERFSSTQDFLASKGIDIAKPEDIKRMISDPTILDEATRKSVIRALIVGYGEGASLGLGGVTLAGKKVLDLAAHTAADVSLAGGTEAAAQQVTTGEVKPGAVISESVGELASAGPEMFAARNEILRGKPEAAATETPSVEPVTSPDAAPEQTGEGANSPLVSSPVDPSGRAMLRSSGFDDQMIDGLNPEEFDGYIQEAVKAGIQVSDAEVADAAKYEQARNPVPVDAQNPAPVSQPVQTANAAVPPAAGQEMASQTPNSVGIAPIDVLAMRRAGEQQAAMPVDDPAQPVQPRPVNNGNLPISDLVALNKATKQSIAEDQATARPIPPAPDTPPSRYAGMTPTQILEKSGRRVPMQGTRQGPVDPALPIRDMTELVRIARDGVKADMATAERRALRDKIIASGEMLSPDVRRDLMRTVRESLAGDVALAARIENEANTLFQAAPKGPAQEPAPVRQTKKPMNLIRFLAKSGGLKDSGGELRAMDLHRKFIPGSGKLVRGNGRTLDDAIRLAVENGYLPQGSTIADFLNAVDQDNRGGDVFSTEQATDAINWKSEEELAARGGKEFVPERKQQVDPDNPYGLTDENIDEFDATYQRVIDAGFSQDVADMVLSLMSEGRGFGRGMDFLSALEEATDQGLSRAMSAAEPTDAVANLRNQINDVPFFGDPEPVNVQDTRAASQTGDRGGPGGEVAGRPAEAGRVDGSRQEPTADGQVQAERGGEDSGSGNRESAAVSQPEVTAAEVMYRAARDDMRDTERGKKSDLSVLMEKSKRFSSARARYAEALAKKDRLVLRNSRDGSENKGAAITPEMGEAGGFRVSYFDERGFSGDSRRDSKIQLINEVIQDGYDVVEDDMLSKFSRTPAFKAGNDATMARQSARPEAVSEKASPAPAAARTEAGADGKPQLVIPGAERAPDRDMAQRKADAPLKPKVQQKDAGGLFSDDANQMDLVDLSRQKPKDDVEYQANPTPPIPNKRPDPKVDRVGTDKWRPMTLPPKPDGVTHFDHIVKWVLEQDKKTGIEHLVVIDDDGTIVGAGTSGVRNKVRMENEVAAGLMNPDRKMVLFHNHPGATAEGDTGSLSIEDIRLLGWPGLHSIWAVNSRGDMDRAALSNRWLRLVDNSNAEVSAIVARVRQLESIASNIRKNALPYFQDAVRFGNITEGQASSLLIGVSPEIMRRAGIIEFQTTRKFDFSSVRGLQSVMDRLVSDLDQALAKQEAKNVIRSRGPADPIRHIGEIGGPFESNAGTRPGGDEPGNGDQGRNANDPGQESFRRRETDREEVRQDGRSVLGRDRIERLIEIIQRTAGLTPEFVRQIKINAERTAAGSFKPGENALSDLITLALDSANDVTAYHEAFHRLQTRFFTERELGLMNMETDRLRQFVMRSSKWTPDMVMSMSPREIQAEAFGIWAAQDGRNVPGVRGVIQSAFARLTATLRRVRAYLKGQGFKTSEDVFAAAKSGEVAKRPEQPRSPDGRFAKLADFQENVSRAPVDPEALPETAESLGARLFALADRATQPVARFIKHNDAHSTQKDGESLARVAKRKLIDRYDPLYQAQKALGMELSDMANPYQAVRLFNGRLGTRIKQINDHYVKPAMKALADAGASIEDLDKYMYALHAEETNRKVGLRNDPDSDFYRAATDPSIKGASGISTNEARKWLAEVASDKAKFAGIKEAAAFIRYLNDVSLLEMKKAGLISADQYENLKNEWKHYVPLKGEEVLSGEGPVTPGNAAGFAVRGKEYVGRTGRFSRADNVIVNSVLQAERVATRIEKNRPVVMMLRLINKLGPQGKMFGEVYWPAATEPGEEVSDITKAKEVWKRELNKDGKVVERKVPNPFSNRDDAVSCKIGGKAYYIKPADPKVGLAMRNMTVEKLGMMARTLRWFTTLTTALNTRYYPEFVFSNIARDVETGASFLTKYGLSAREIGKSIKDIGPASLAVWRYNRGDTKADGVWDKHIHDFVNAGGKMNFNPARRIEDAMNDLVREVKDAGPGLKPLKRIRDGLQLIDDFTDAGENAYRLSVFVALKAKGFSTDKAAFIARDLTVDFAKHGEMGPNMNALYAFFNASLQGAANTIVQIFTNPRFQKIMGGLVVGGLLQHIINMAFAGNDDDGENRYLKMLRTEPWQFERQIVFFIPGTDGKMFKFPLGFGLNAAWYTGAKIGQVWDGGTSAGEAALDIGGVTFDAFNPMGSGSFWNMLAPTILDPAVDLMQNLNFFGAPIYPEKNPYQQNPQPNSQVAFGSTSDEAKLLAETLNKITGGDEVKSGWADFHPETLEHIAGAFTGSLGRFFGRIYETGVNATQGELDPTKAPFLRTVYSEFGEQNQKRDYYDQRARVNEIEANIKAYRKLKEFDKAKQEADDNPREYRSIGVFNSVEKALDAIRKQRREIMMSDMPIAEKDRRMEALAKREADQMLRARKAYFEAGK